MKRKSSLLTYDELCRRVADAGVVGMGGGGFPTHLKFRPRLDAVIVNGAECEPLLDCDYFTLKRHGEAVIRGARAVASGCGAADVVLAVKRKNAALAEALAPLGGFRAVLLDDVYPSGDELFVIRAALGRTLPQGVIPSFEKIYVGNAATLKAVDDALAGVPFTRRLVTVCGAVREPGTFDVPLGTRFGDLVAACGGVRVAGARLVEGGVMMGALASDDDVVRKTTSGVVALPPDHPAVLERLRPLAYSARVAEHACCQCARCSELCSRRFLGHDLAPHRLMRLVGARRDYRALHSPTLFNCSGCGLCSLIACPFDLSPRRLILEARRVVPRPQGVVPPEPAPPPEASCVAVPTKKVMAKLQLNAWLAPHRFAGEFPLPAALRVPLQQHAGRPAVAAVQPGECVEAGQVIGRPADGGPSAAVHAPAAGTVESVGDSVTIRTGFGEGRTGG
ncbi:MAG: SLBB domain-containing protein [Acidobacteria bacterium]|nr:SLBB domain-containing protein [Acidobacteriota bacterium]